MQKLPSPKLAWFSLSLFYMYLYVLRVFPSIAESELRTDLVLSAAEFSSIGAFYLATYGAMQIPLGSIVNRLGLRNIALGAILACIIGGGITSLSNQLWLLQLGRLLLGAGAAPVFMCAMKLCADYIPPAHRGLYMGVTLTMGTFGALITGNLVVNMIEMFSWRITSALLTVAAVPILILILHSIPRTPASTDHTTILDRRSLKEVFSNKFVYIFGILGLGLFASLNVFTDLWGTAYLVKRFTVSRTDAAAASMLMYIGLALGSLLLPWYFATKKRVFWGIRLCSTSILILFSSLMFFETASFLVIKLFLFFIGVFSGGIMLVFSGAALWTKKETSGLTISVINTFNMLGGAILNQTVGFILNYTWSGEVDTASVPQYSLSAKNNALIWVLGTVFVLTLIFGWYTPKSKVVKKYQKQRKA